jgi:NAD(P)-dependent dehydrogenase (short-subunit alcohol dehydrogenase family)
MASTRSLNTRYYAFCGGTAGIGQAAAYALAEKGANIAVIGRNADIGDKTVDVLLSKGASTARFIKGDLSTIVGARATAQDIQAWSPRLDGLVHSAMSAFSEKIITSDDLEFAFALQYFARVIIDNLLLENLAASKDGRIVQTYYLGTSRVTQCAP